MGQEFDPYLQWLGISKKEPRPVHFYRLLGVDKFETDADVIAMNGDKQIEHLRKFSSGPHGDFAEQLINMLIKAKLTLLKPERKEVYDQQLRAAAQAAAPITLPPPATAYPSSVSVATAAALNVPSAPTMSNSPPNAPEQGYPEEWNPGAMTAPAAAPAMMLPAGNSYPAVSAAPTTGENDFPNVETAVRSFAPKSGPATKPRNSLVPWLIVAASVAVCVGLTMMLANRYADKDPVAGKDPAAKKTNPPETTPDASPAKVPSVAPSPNKETQPDPSAPEKNVPQPEPNPTKATPVAINKPKSAWPPIDNPRAVQVIVQDPKNPKMTLYRYPGTNPRMATIITQGQRASSWSIENEELLLRSNGAYPEFFLFGDPTWTDYTIECELYVDNIDINSGQTIPFSIVFRSAEDTYFPQFRTSQNYAELQLWSRDSDAPPRYMSSFPDRKTIGTSQTVPLKPKLWTNYSVKVNGKHSVIVKSENFTILNESTELPDKGRVGMMFEHASNTTARVRNIRVTAPDGTVLWAGLPELPPSLDSVETKAVPQDIAAAERTNRFPGPSDDAPNKGPGMTNDPLVKNISIPNNVPEPNPLDNPNPKPTALNPALSVLAEKDEDVKKFLEELSKAQETYQSKVKKFEEDYLKGFDTELARVRTTSTLNASERADLLQTMAEDKKDFETKKRYSIAHGMLPKNIVISSILVERQRYERVYEQMIDRMLKEERDEVALALKKALKDDPNLRPLRVFSVHYYHTPSSAPVRYEFFADKSVNNNPQITWYIDADKRLNITGPLQSNRPTIEQLQISLDGRKLVNGKSKTSTVTKTGKIIVD